MDHDWEGPYTDECGRHDITKRKLKEVQEECDRLLEELAQAREERDEARQVAAILAQWLGEVEAPNWAGNNADERSQAIYKAGKWMRVEEPR